MPVCMCSGQPRRMTGPSVSEISQPSCQWNKEFWALVQTFPMGPVMTVR